MFDTQIILQIIIDNIPNAIFWKDKNFIFQGCNKKFAKQFGYSSSKDIVGKSDYDLPFSHDLIKKYQADDAVIMNTGISKCDYEEQQTQVNGEIKTLLVSKVPLYDKTNKVIGVLGIYTDITEKKIQEEQLQQAKQAAEAANHAKTEFIANMSHDIRTPLTGVVGMSQLLENSVSSLEQKQYAHWLGESGDQLLHMLNDILDVIKLDSINDSDVHITSFDVRDMLNSLLQLERPTILTKGLELKLWVDSRVPHSIISDETKLSRIILNLLGNSIKFTHKGFIQLSIFFVKKINDSVVLKFSVIDTGVGIAPELQPHVFDRFFRITPSYEGIYTGHGVGLHIAQSYAHALGSNIILRSELNVGTTFEFELKVKIGKLEKDREAKEDKRFVNDFSKESYVDNDIIGRVLLVEDNKIALKILESLVEKFNLSYISTTDGQQAYDLSTSEHFDLIITDLGLPVLSGQDFIKKLRVFECEHAINPVPVVGLTAHVSANIQQESKKSGINKVLSKPITEKILADVIDVYLQAKLDTKFESNVDLEISTLGLDLPSTEEELFKITSLPLLDAKSALESIGNDIELYNKILQTMAASDLPKDLAEIHIAYEQKNWDEVERLAHRLKGGLAYLGTIRLNKASLYLERYHKAGHTKYLEELYKQFRLVAAKTLVALKNYKIN